MWDVNSIYGLIEALGGAEVLGKVIPTRDHGNPTEHVLDWARSGWIPPGLHLRLLGMAAAIGKTIYPPVFDMCATTPGWQGLIDLGYAVAAVRR